MIPDLFVKCSNEGNDYDGLNKLPEKHTEGPLENLEHLKWAKFLLEIIYKIWF